MSDFEMADTNPSRPNAGTPTASGGLAAPVAPMNDAATAETFEKVFFELRKVIVGQSRLLERLLVGVLCRGHCLLESVPGLAKTLAAETLAAVVGGSFARIQFTPDLLPSDIVGTRIYRAGSETFDVELGPVFVNFLLTDEINRAPAKVQSALLEVMAEQQVTIGGITHPVDPPFFGVATQNPIESEGVYQLPTTPDQVDRLEKRGLKNAILTEIECAYIDKNPYTQRGARSAKIALPRHVNASARDVAIALDELHSDGFLSYETRTGWKVEKSPI